MKIGGTTMNFVYGSDIVPRGYSHLHFIGEVLDKIAEESPETVGSIANTFSSWIGVFTSFGFVRKSLQDIIGGASKDVSGVFIDFRHQGKRSVCGCVRVRCCAIVLGITEKNSHINLSRCFSFS